MKEGAATPARSVRNRFPEPSRISRRQLCARTWGSWATRTFAAASPTGFATADGTVTALASSGWRRDQQHVITGAQRRPLCSSAVDRDGTKVAASALRDKRLPAALSAASSRAVALRAIRLRPMRGLLARRARTRHRALGGRAQHDF